MTPKITLKDISKNLNLSVSTVSRALKGHPDISEETREKVMRLAALMEYEPNTYAISLRTNKSRIFGLIVPEISNYFYHSFISSLEEECRKIGYSLLILQSGNNPVTEAENIKLCRLNRVAGVFVSITSGTSDLSAFQKLEENDVPVIFFDKVPDSDTCNKICLADEQAAETAAELLLKKGKQSVLAIFGNSNLSITQRRKKAFSRTMEKTGAVSSWYEYADSAAEAFSIAEKYLAGKKRPDSVFCMSDEILTGVMKAIQRKKLAVPGEIGIVAISNDGFIPRLYEPEITYIETSGYKLGKLAFRRIMDHMEGKRFYRELVLPGTVVEGGSV